MLAAGQDAAEAFYRVVDAAYERRSVAVTSNLHPSGFDSIMPKTLATATVDRLLHHAHLVATKGDSHRLAQALAGKGVTPLDPTPHATQTRPSVGQRRRIGALRCGPTRRSCGGIVPGLPNLWPQPTAIRDRQANATGPQTQVGGIRLGLSWSGSQCGVSTENSGGIATIGYPRVGRGQIAVGVFLGHVLRV